MINDPSLQAVIDALTMYQNDLDTLQPVVKASEAYLGDDWISMLPNVLDKAELEASQKDLLKERADHAIHYYGATAAYSEIQEYLKDPKQLDKAQVTARLPILEYWMEFFGSDGMDLVRTLKTKLEPDEEPTPQWDAQMEKLQQEVQPPAVEEQMVDEDKLFENPQGTPADAVAQAFENILRPEDEQQADEDGVVAEEPAEAEPVVAEPAAEEPIVKEEDILQEPVEEPVAQEESVVAEPVAEESVVEEPVASKVEEPVEKEPEDAVVQEPVVDESLVTEPVEITPVEATEEDASLAEDKNFPTTMAEAEAQTQSTPQQRENTQKDWDIENFTREWALYDGVFSWINARCLRLKLSDKRRYPYYGFLVDLMRSLRDDAQALLDNAKYEAILPVEVKGGREAVEGLVAALDKEILDLSDEFPTSVEEQLNPKEIEKVFGPLDTGPEEDIGPAPDGFELIDDPYAKQTEVADQEPEEPKSKKKK